MGTIHEIHPQPPPTSEPPPKKESLVKTLTRSFFAGFAAMISTALAFDFTWWCLGGARSSSMAFVFLCFGVFAGLAAFASAEASRG